MVKYQIKTFLVKKYHLLLGDRKKISGYDIIFCIRCVNIQKGGYEFTSVKQDIEKNPGCKHPHVVLLCNTNERENVLSKIVHSLFKLLPFEHRIDYITSMNAK